MHAGNLGVLLTWHGSTFEDFIVTQGKPVHSGSMKERCQCLLSELQTSAKALGKTLPLTNLMPAMFYKPNDFAVLHVSAADSRKLMPIVLHLLKRFSAGTNIDAHRMWCYDHLEAMYDTIEKGNIVLDDGPATDLLDHCE